jgi:hypothetical protein
MSQKPPQFGDVYEWDVPTGTVRWMVIGPALSGALGEWEALMLQSTPQFASDPALHRVTSIGLETPDNVFHPYAPKRLLAEGTQ